MDANTLEAIKVICSSITFITVIISFYWITK